MPIPPPPPGGPPPPPTHSQSKSRPLSLNADRGALLSDICRGTKLRKVTDTNDRSAPLLLQNKTNDRSTPNVHQNKTNASVILQSSGDQPRRRSLTAHSPPDSKTPPSEHPYFRLYQYLQQGAPRTSSSSDKPKADGANGSAASSPSGPAPPITGLFPGGVPKLRTASDGSCSRPSSRPVAPRPPSQRHDDTDGSAPSSVPPSQCRRGNAPSPPINAYNREKPLPPTPPPASKPRPPTSGGNPAPNSLAPPPDLPQRHNSLNKRPAPSPTGHTPTRGPAPPPPSPAHNRPTPSSLSPAHQAARPPPPIRDPPTRDPPTKDTPTKDPSTKEPRATAPTAPVSAPVQSLVQSPVQTPVQSSPRPGCREAPPPPPGRVHGSPALSADPPSRGKPPPPPRTPAAPPPPPPPHRNGPCSSPRLRLLDDFESKYSFHPLDDFPPPEEYRHFTKIYPSKANRVMRGAPPLPPVAR